MDSLTWREELPPKRERKRANLKNVRGKFVIAFKGISYEFQIMYKNYFYIELEKKKTGFRGKVCNGKDVKPNITETWRLQLRSIWLDYEQETYKLLTAYDYTKWKVIEVNIK